MRPVQAELLDQDPGVVLAGEGRPDVHFRVYEADVLELHDRVGDLPGPVLAAGLDHSNREPVQRDVEDVAPLAREPGGQAAVLVVVLEQEHAVARLREHVGAREAAQAASYDDHVILVGDSLEPVISHGGPMLEEPPGSRQLVSGP